MGFEVERAFAHSIGVKPKHIVVSLTELLAQEAGASREEVKILVATVAACTTVDALMNLWYASHPHGCRLCRLSPLVSLRGAGLGRPSLRMPWAVLRP